MAKKKKTDDFVDDGRTIAPMDVEGMPGYVPKAPGAEFSSRSPVSSDMDFGEKVSAMGGVVAALLLIVLLFAVVFFLAIVVFDLPALLA